MLSHIAKLILLWGLIIFHCMHVHNLTLIHPLIDIWVVSTSCLLWIMMWECKDPFGNPGSSSFGYVPRNGIARSSSVFTFWGTSPCRLCRYYCVVARACPTLRSHGHVIFRVSRRARGGKWAETWSERGAPRNRADVENRRVGKGWGFHERPVPLQ